MRFVNGGMGKVRGEKSIREPKLTPSSSVAWAPFDWPRRTLMFGMKG